MEKYPIEYDFREDVITISILVDDLEKAKSFYGDVFGFHPSYIEGEQFGWSELYLPVEKVKLGLDLVEKLPENRDKRNAAFGLCVKDLDAAKKYLESKNVKVGEIQDIPNMVSLMNCWDPFGNRIFLNSSPRVID